MPFFRTAGKIVYFAHIPKCGGTSVEHYLIERFGPLAMFDRYFQSGDPSTRWSRTSPQHIDWRSLQTILPPDYIDAVFTVVRHPIARAESAYHFQIGVEKTVTPETPFSDWLADQMTMLDRDPFALDSHMRPQTDFVPEGAAVFHLEHGPDALIPYLDGLAGGSGGPRAIGHSNKRASGKQKAAPPPHQVPGPADIARLVEVYAADFERFGYTPESRTPQAARPVLDEAFRQARDRERARRDRLTWKLRAKAQRWLDRP